MSKTLGPSSRVTANEKLPFDSTSAGSPLILTTAPASVWPRIVTVFTSRTLSSAGSMIVRNREVGVDDVGEHPGKANASSATTTRTRTNLLFNFVTQVLPFLVRLPLRCKAYHELACCLVPCPVTGDDVEDIGAFLEGDWQ